MQEGQNIFVLLFSVMVLEFWPWNSEVTVPLIIILWFCPGIERFRGDFMAKGIGWGLFRRKTRKRRPSRVIISAGYFIIFPGFQSL